MDHDRGHAFGNGHQPADDIIALNDRQDPGGAGPRRDQELASLDRRPATENAGAGNGTALVRALEQAACAIGVLSIRLFSRRTTAKFWQRLGYEAEADPRYLAKRAPFAASEDKP